VGTSCMYGLGSSKLLNLIVLNYLLVVESFVSIGPQ
jgi:hypothetical protein